MFEEDNDRHEGQQKTQDGVLGTPAFMAPEQAEGRIWCADLQIGHGDGERDAQDGASEVVISCQFSVASSRLFD